MKLTFQIVIIDGSGSSRTEELMSLQKSGDALNDIGLSVSESKQLLGAVQKSLVQQQADEYIHQNIRCPHCLTKRRIKGQQKIQYRTLFGVIPVSGLRVYRCRCEESATKTVSLLSDWAGDHTHPALKYIETRWASLISYEMTVRLLKDVLPEGLQASDPATGSKVLSLLESSKRYLWHGNVATALDRIDDCVMYCDDPELNYANLKALQKQLDEMYTYIRNNQMMIPNYGEMRRYGEPVSTAFVESTINEVIARRMAKKQQMQWSRKGAHYLLQARTAVLNNELQDKFASWYPGCTIDAQSRGTLSAMAA